jgi:hypothetical protein
MADTTYVAGVTAIPAAWLNPINDLAHTYMGIDASTGAPTKLQFPASQSASADANALDDYEEGSWTPALGGTATYSSRSGSYVKIGKIVFIRGRINVNAIGSGSTTILSGLPFSAANTDEHSGSVSQWANLATNVLNITCKVTANASTITFNAATASGATSSNAVAIFGDSVDLYFNAAYEV